MATTRTGSSTGRRSRHNARTIAYPAGTIVSGNTVLCDVDEHGNPLVDDRMFEQILNDRDRRVQPRGRTHRIARATRTSRKTTARRTQAHSASTRSSSCDDSGGGEPPHPPGFPPSAVEPTHGHRKPVAR